LARLWPVRSCPPARGATRRRFGSQGRGAVGDVTGLLCMLPRLPRRCDPLARSPLVAIWLVVAGCWLVVVVVVAGGRLLAGGC
jgi:hypothetical protein